MQESLIAQSRPLKLRYNKKLSRTLVNAKVLHNQAIHSKVLITDLNVKDLKTSKRIKRLQKKIKCQNFDHG